MSERDTPGALAAALAQVQSKLPEVHKDQRATVKSDKGSYSYTYANLGRISAALMPLLAENGLAFLAKPTMHEGAFVLAYSLIHQSGEREDGFYPLRQGGTPQAMGGEITYARRYSLCAVTGLAPEDDDDDAAAAQKEAKEDREQRRSEPPPDQWQTPPTAQSTNKFAGLMADFTHLGVTEKPDYRAITSAILNRPVASITDLDERALKTLRTKVHEIRQLPEEEGQRQLDQLRRIAAEHTAEENRVDRPAERQGARLSKEETYSVSDLRQRILAAPLSEIRALFAEAEREGVLEETTLGAKPNAEGEYLPVTTIRGLLTQRQLETSAEGEK